MTMANAERVIQPSEYRVISITKPEDNDLEGLALVKVEVDLPVATVEELHRKHLELIKRWGQPTVMVIMTDRVEDRRPGFPRITVREENDTAQALAEGLQKAGFRVIVKVQAEVIRRNKVDMADLKGEDLAVIEALARKELAHIFVWGEGRAVGPDSDDVSVPGRRRWIWSSDAKCRVYCTDDASQIAAERAMRLKASDQDVDSACILALQKAGDELARIIVPSLFDTLGKQAVEGRPVSIQVLNATAEEGDEIGDYLTKVLSGEGTLDVQFDNGVVDIRVLSKLRADELRRTISRGTFQGFRLQANDSKQNTMQFKVVHGALQAKGDAP